MPLPLNTISWGDGLKRALLLHGITSNAAGWWRLGPDIAAQGYTVVAADLRGHGSSPRREAYHVSDYAEDVLALGTWDLVIGHSVGGAIATAAQATEGSWSRRLVLEDPVVVIPDAEKAIAWLASDFEGPPDADALLRANPAWAAEDAATKAEALRQTSVEVVQKTFRVNDPWDQRELFARLEVPTLVIGADPELGALVPPQLGSELAAHPLVEFTQIMGSHSMHRDAYDDLWRTLLPWVTSDV
jgi:pimeloyl-ACP methyl ester carboxylesterase